MTTDEALEQMELLVLDREIDYPLGQFVFIVSVLHAAELGAALVAHAAPGLSTRRVSDPGFIGWCRGVPVVMRHSCPSDGIYLFREEDCP